MIFHILLIIVGLVVVLLGADRLTAGAVALASRLGVSQMMIGLTVVALGTSMPEFCVSLLSAMQGTPDLAMGNVVGSNVMNSLLIVGVAALITPIAILRDTVKRDIPFALVASMLLYMLASDGALGRLDAAVLILLFVVYMSFTVRTAHGDGHADGEAAARQLMSVPLAMVWLLVGLAALVGGANLFVSNASAVASALGVSDAVIGLTIVAGGTSLPELATTAVAAYRGNSGIAIGNVLGSNVFNLLFVLGMTGIITPMLPQGITTVDYTLLVVSMMLLWLFSFTKLRIERWEGGLLALTYLGYVAWLITQAV